MGRLAAGAYALGFALGAAPGPVQLLILSETARGGLGRGLRVMAGANGTLLAVLAALALGLSAIEPAPSTLDALRIAGGAFLVLLGASELATLVRGGSTVAAATGRDLGPTGRGVVSVVLNPGAWVFFATTASAVLTDASDARGRTAALVAAIAMAAGVSTSDLSFSLLGSGGRRLLGERGVARLRGALAAALVAIGVWFVVDGLA